MCIRDRGSAFDKTNVSGAWPLGGFLRRELYALSLAQQLEDRLAYGAAMKKVLDTALISTEAEALVDEQTRDCAGRHSRVPPMLRQKLGQCREVPLAKSSTPEAVRWP